MHALHGQGGFLQVTTSRGEVFLLKALIQSYKHSPWSSGLRGMPSPRRRPVVVTVVYGLMVGEEQQLERGGEVPWGLLLLHRKARLGASTTSAS